MKTIRLFTFLCVAASGTIALPHVRAQAGPNPESPNGQPPNPIIAEVDFKGKKVRDVVEFLRQKGQANIVTDPQVDDLPVAELKLRNVTMYAAVQALTVATGGAIQALAPHDLAGIIELQPTVAAKPKPDIVTRVFRLPDGPEKGLDEALAAVQEAIDKAMQLNNEALAKAGLEKLPLPSLEVHRPTRLILVAGPRQSVEVARQVIGVLRGEGLSEPNDNSLSPALVPIPAPAPAPVRAMPAPVPLQPSFQAMPAPAPVQPSFQAMPAPGMIQPPPAPGPSAN